MFLFLPYQREVSGEDEGPELALEVGSGSTRRLYVSPTDILSRLVPPPLLYGSLVDDVGSRTLLEGLPHKVTTEEGTRRERLPSTPSGRRPAGSPSFDLDRAVPGESGSLSRGEIPNFKISLGR